MTDYDYVVLQERLSNKMRKYNPYVRRKASNVNKYEL